MGWILDIFNSMIGSLNQIGDFIVRLFTGGSTEEIPNSAVTSAENADSPADLPKLKLNNGITDVNPELNLGAYYSTHSNLRVNSPTSENSYGLGKIQALGETWQYNLSTILGPTNPAPVNAVLSEEDRKYYHLEYDEFGVLRRFTADGRIHPIDGRYLLILRSAANDATNQNGEEILLASAGIPDVSQGILNSPYKDPIEYDGKKIRIASAGMSDIDPLLQGPKEPEKPPILLQNTFKMSSSSTEYFSYKDKDGNIVTKRWTITDQEFLDYNALTQEQITSILMSKNPELVKRGFDTAIYKNSQKMGINPKVLLSSLSQEQGWCLNGDYDAAFGIGPGGTPGSFVDGGIEIAARLYLDKFSEGRSYNGNIPEMTVNQDADGRERKAVFGPGTAAWEAAHPQYVQYMNEGITIKPVNAAMYVKLIYTPWIDFPPQGSHPLEDWQDIFRSF